MTEETTPTPQRSDSDKSGRSGYRQSATVAAVDSRSNGGSGVQRSHLRDRKAWLKDRRRAGQSWAQRKAASTTYCPAKVRAS